MESSHDVVAGPAVRHHVRFGWWFTRMPNGDVVVSAGDGVQGITIAPNEWESVVREMSGHSAGAEAERDTLKGALREVLEHYHAPCPDCWDVIGRAYATLGEPNQHVIAPATPTEGPDS